MASPLRPALARLCLLACAAFVTTPARAAEPASALALPPAILPASVLRSEAIELAPTHPAVAATGWRGLVCRAAACELRPLRLEVQALQDPPRQRIADPAAGRRVPVKGEFTIALLHGLAGAGRQPVATWFTLRTPRAPQDAANGSLGVTVDVPGQGAHRLVPRWREDGRDRFLTLYLEASGRRQRLGRIGLEAVNAGLKASDILIWAGDLDGDGRIDLITRAGDDPAQRGLHLWLSGRAQPGEMVGPAASLDAWTDVEETEGC